MRHENESADQGRGVCVCADIGSNKIQTSSPRMSAIFQTLSHDLANGLDVFCPGKETASHKTKTIFSEEV